MLYGAVIDSTCRVLQQSCTRKGACLLYDHDNFRFRLHLLPLCCQVATVALKAAAWYLSRRREQTSAATVITRVVHRDDTASDGNLGATSEPENEGKELNIEKETIF